MRTKQSRRLAAGTLAMILGLGSAAAQELKIGMASEPTSIDPHFHNLGPNNALRLHIFQSLIDQDAQQKLVPALAESWRAVDPTTWEFKLRKGVKFHDGSDFIAKDVIYTVCRIPTVENSPSSFTVYTKAISGMQAPDPHTLVVQTEKPHPLLPNEISTWGILSATANGATSDIAFKKEGCDGIGTPPKSEAFNSPKTSIGTGPYKLVEYVRGDRLVLERFDGYWGGRPSWSRIIFRPITSEGPRVAALLAGDVDMIETPPIQDLPRIKQAGFTVSQGLSNRVIYLALDQFAEPTPGVKGTDGKNPFKDRRVRQAVSKAINRDAIVERIMGGIAVPAGDLLAPEFFGGDANRKPESHDPEGAKKLLAEAGYPNGFELVLGSPNDRYVNDEKIAQAVAQMLTRVGIKTSVDAVTASQFFSRRNKYEFSVYLAGWGSGTGEMSSPLAALVATPDKAKGRGGTNAARYSNPKMDALLDEALATVDDEKREDLLRAASRAVGEDHGIIPLHYEVTTWAVKKGLAYKARADQYTLAFEVLPAR